MSRRYEFFVPEHPPEMVAAERLESIAADTDRQTELLEREVEAVERAADALERLAAAVEGSE